MTGHRSLTTYEPMTARMVPDDTGAHPEPPYDPSWPELDRLRWKAGLVEYETGLHITISTGGASRRIADEWVTVPNVYGVNVGSSSSSARPFSAVWDFLNGVEVGATQINRRTTRSTP